MRRAARSTVPEPDVSDSNPLGRAPRKPGIAEVERSRARRNPVAEVLVEYECSSTSEFRLDSKPATTETTFEFLDRVAGEYWAAVC